MNKDVLVAPATGKLIPLEEVPDPVFGQKMMGEGLAIDPSEGVIVAPIDAEVATIIGSKHAIGLKTKNNTEILIHVGLETVAMGGEGFEVFVKEGDQVKQGDKLITFNLDLIREKAKSTITPVIITNTDAQEKIEKTSEASLVKGETTLLTVTPK
ncbi:MULTISPECIES: PTS sugar transporter subunit IIA [Bacillus]|uniref:PTS sugar transporter subunit IIA n=1 Tax=Bacillus TaxID=1386 RepID=UPI000304D037|nr:MULTISPECIES: PTS glucose transporter subunit IIA [Bacillus]